MDARRTDGARTSGGKAPIAAQCANTSSQLLARTGPPATSDLSPLSGVERKLDFGDVRAVDDPGCVKTCAHEKHAELFSPLSWKDCMKPARVAIEELEFFRRCR